MRFTAYCANVTTLTSRCGHNWIRTSPKGHNKAYWQKCYVLITIDKHKYKNCTFQHFGQHKFPSRSYVNRKVKICQICIYFFSMFLAWTFSHFDAHCFALLRLVSIQSWPPCCDVCVWSSLILCLVMFVFRAFIASYVKYWS